MNKKHFLFLIILFISFVLLGLLGRYMGFIGRRQYKYVRYGDAILINKPPTFAKPESDSLITGGTNFIVYGKLISKKPLRFDKEAFIHFQSGSSFPNCLISSDDKKTFRLFSFLDSYSDSGERLKKDGYIADNLNIKEGAKGFFWVNAQQCYIFDYKPSVPDYTLYFGYNDGLRNRDIIFSGEIIGLNRDMSYEDWNYKSWHKKKNECEYYVKVDTLYLDLYNSFRPSLKVEIVGSIPPKQGKLYFFGEVHEEKGVIEAFIFNEPRKIWFSPRSGRYKVHITNMQFTEVLDSSFDAHFMYEVTGQVVSTSQGLIQDEKEIQFRYDNPPFKKGQTYDFVGIITDSMQTTRLNLVR